MRENSLDSELQFKGSKQDREKKAGTIRDGIFFFS